MNVSINDLKHYFDAQEKDARDVSSRSHRSREVLMLRDQLLALSDQEFNATIRTFKSILKNSDPQDTEGPARATADQQDAKILFESSSEKS